MASAGNPAALGADLLEVGYPLRAGVDLNHYLALWDIMSRNAVLLTGTGVSDDHVGDDWYGIGNNWITSVWAASTGMADLISALAAGRTWCGSLGAYRGALDPTQCGTASPGSGYDFRNDYLGTFPLPGATAPTAPVILGSPVTPRCLS